MLTLLILFLSFSRVFACDCWELKPYQSQEDLANYSYIALVRIDSVFLSQDRKEDEYFYETSITTLTQYKGKKGDRLLVDGGLYGLTDWMTSCDFGVSQGEIWLLFSGHSHSNKPMVYSCTYTRMVSNVKGEKSWFHNPSNEAVSSLDKIFNIKIELKPNGIDTTYYPNGQIELIESYNNGELDGKRTAFLANGSKVLEEYYKNGLRDGKQFWYRDKHRVYREWNFKNDLPIDTCYYFYSDGQIQYERIFDMSGRLIKDSKFDKKGKTEKVNYEYPDENVYDVFRYYKDGKVWYRTRYTLDTHKEVLQEEFHPNGKKAAEWDYRIANDTIIYSLKRWDIQGEFVIHRLYKDSRTYIDIFKN